MTFYVSFTYLFLFPLALVFLYYFYQFRVDSRNKVLRGEWKVIHPSHSIFLISSTFKGYESSENKKLDRKKLFATGSRKKIYCTESFHYWWFRNEKNYYVHFWSVLVWTRCTLTAVEFEMCEFLLPRLHILFD